MLFAADTSVAVPLIMLRHAAHDFVLKAVSGRRLALPAHAQAETYAVVTRLPGDARVAPADAVKLIDDNFIRILMPDRATSERLPELCAAAGVAGGASYDALVALTAHDHGSKLLTRDRRAQATYESLNIAFKIIEGD